MIIYISCVIFRICWLSMFIIWVWLQRSHWCKLRNILPTVVFLLCLMLMTWYDWFVYCVPLSLTAAHVALDRYWLEIYPTQLCWIDTKSILICRLSSVHKVTKYHFMEFLGDEMVFRFIRWLWNQYWDACQIVGQKRAIRVVLKHRASRWSCWCWTGGFLFHRLLYHYVVLHQTSFEKLGSSTEYKIFSPKFSATCFFLGVQSWSLLRSQCFYDHGSYFTNFLYKNHHCTINARGNN